MLPDEARKLTTERWPCRRRTEIRLKRAEQVLDVAFDDGARFALPAEYLRVESPSAEVQGHGPGQKVIVAGRRHVGILRVEPVGNYAVRLVFDDLHDTGIYSWDYLHRLGAEQEALGRLPGRAGGEGPVPRPARAGLIPASIKSRPAVTEGGRAPGRKHCFRRAAASAASRRRRAARTTPSRRVEGATFDRRRLRHDVRQHVMIHG